MKNCTLFSLASATAVLAFSAAIAQASTLYAINGDGSINGVNDVYTIDQSTGAGTFLGNSGLTGSFLADLASNHTNTLWATDENNAHLVTIDPTTGAGTVVGTFDSPTTIDSLAYNAAGITSPVGLYGNTTQITGATDDELYSVNPLTAATTPIGLIGFDDVYALAFDNNGNLFGLDVDGQLLSINPTTGAGTFVANLDLPDLFYGFAARPEDNTMFVIADDVVGTGGDIYTLNTTNGDLTDVGPSGMSAGVGLAFIAVPEPTSLGLMALGTLALFNRRRPATR
jgi:hypothetical protein